ncbi:MAG: M20 family metallopeptidase [Armatimonadota bacterium]|nr:M20 family metallopeptidase [Armatimonadota bacterium]
MSTAVSPERVEALVSPDEITALARSLVAIPSFGPEHGWESGVAAALEDLLRAEGIPTRRQPVDDGRENLIGVLPGARDGPPLLILNGHMDTVPPSSLMARPPFAAEVAGGELWGRGAADMKAGLAAMVMAAVALHRAAVRPPRPVVLAAVAMEEMGNVGTHVFAEDLVASGAQASGAVVGEPTGLGLVTAHKGVDRYRVTVFGRAAHGATPEHGCNAIVRASRLIVALEEQVIRRAPPHTHPLLGRPTYNIGTIHGGTSRNTVPDRCTFQIEKRYLPGERVSQFREELEAVVARSIGREGAELVHESGFDRIPHRPLDIAPDHALVAALAAAVAEVTGRAPQTFGWPAFTDAAILQAHGIPAVVCGPGELARAHADDERVPLAQIADAVRIYVRLVLRLAGMA